MLKETIDRLKTEQARIERAIEALTVLDGGAPPKRPGRPPKALAAAIPAPAKKRGRKSKKHHVHVPNLGKGKGFIDSGEVVRQARAALEAAAPRSLAVSEISANTGILPVHLTRALKTMTGVIITGNRRSTRYALESAQPADPAQYTNGAGAQA